MSTKVVQFPRAGTEESDAYTGPEGQVTVDVDRQEFRLHDGVTPGGIRIVSLDQLEILFRASSDDPLGDLPEVGLGLVTRVGDGAYVTREITAGEGLIGANPAGTGGDPGLAVDFASDLEAAAGVVDDKSMTPATTAVAVAAAIGTLEDDVAAAEDAIEALTVEMWSFLIESVVDGDYQVIQNIPYAVDILSITTISESGTATLTGKIGTTALGGTANAVSTSEQVQAHASANHMNVSDNFKLTFSANALATKVTVTIKVAR